ncbi:pyrroline-5-carboxylate reductase dimerization domain-containing protein, partial [Staphylococcus sp. EG-SA-26]|uniref:pyrroline-5-carboxylate reductase dimerization domain-containing protein n=1 Tax=Staphylococcus sp. EG-SA-26 TaxID=2767498 RepID=UPI00237B6296
ESIRNLIIGTSKMIERSDLSMAQLRKNITSKGGTTQAGLDTFEHNGQVYQSKDFRGESKQGPVVAIFGDTKPCSNERVISR